jgi:hypothetical protein
MFMLPGDSGLPIVYHRVKSLFTTKEICEENHSGKLHGRTASCFKSRKPLEVDCAFSIEGSTDGPRPKTENTGEDFSDR